MFKKYMAIVGGVCAVTLTLVVALRIAPEAWAVIAGILFGGLASVPMCFIAYMLVRRQSVAPTQPAYPQQPQVIIMRDDGTMLPRRQPQAYIPAPQYQQQYAEADYVEGDYYEYEQPTTARPAYGTRIVNQQPNSVRVIGGRR